MGNIMNNGLSDTVDNELLKRENDYLEYIDLHIANVQKAFNNLFVSRAMSLVLPGYTKLDTEKILRSLRVCVLSHDQSKYSDEEFYSYRKKYYPTNKESRETDQNVIDKINTESEEAWIHHYLNNDHHPKFYSENNITKRGEYDFPLEWHKKIIGTDTSSQDMSIISILHAICDWEAMSMYFKSNTIDWWVQKAANERKCMTPKTLETFCEILKILYPNNPTNPTDLLNLDNNK